MLPFTGMVSMAGFRYHLKSKRRNLAPGNFSCGIAVQMSVSSISAFTSNADVPFHAQKVYVLLLYKTEDDRKLQTVSDWLK